MGLSDAPLLFNFEHVSSENLTYIPMIVRFNLDRFGLRISLEQWQLLPLEDRKLLARFPADDDTAIEPNFDHALFEMLRTHADLEPEWFEPDAQPAWRDTDTVPDALAQQSALAGVPAPALAQWRQLAPFQRYVLCKLSRKPKLNHDFLPAMREFGLTAAP
ncbi:nitrate reductase associated protein [Burkholderia dolosa]|uniref:nitrate reductase associated protein n=1 Tax=Burkholderia dolosa TaxID=152500 RepID=UPI001C9738CF|nr:nitrate reductase associated protein [Burkholderia dolosa]MBY4831232.1 nitrate reductase associated protein [Burkholderia dolosa]